jgi:hypothetical protein
MVRCQLCRFCCGGSCINSGQNVLWPACAAFMGSTFLCIRTSLDNFVCPNGGCSMASLVLRRIPCSSQRTFSVCIAAHPECPMELAFLCLAPRRLGIRRYRPALGSNRGHHQFLLARPSFGRSSPYSVSALGEFCIGVKLFCLAAQSADPGLVAMLPNHHISRTQPLRGRSGYPER